MASARFPAGRITAVITLALTLTACGSDEPTGSDGGEEPTGNVMAISAGGAHTCALRTDGAAFCWGQNSSGQLGDPAVASSLTPIMVDTDLRFRAISAGDTHTCAITEGDQLYCWGDNVHGQVLPAAEADVGLPPTLVPGIAFEMVSAGLDHSCGVATDGDAWCWGQAYLGDGDADPDRKGPVLVQGGPWRTISAAVNYTCAVSTSNAAYCWGVNAQGLLGVGTDETPYVDPTAVAGNHSFTTVSSGVTSSCAITTGNETWCWGGNNVGQLGVDSTTPYANTPQLVAGGHPFTSVDVGELQACASTGQRAMCWGHNALGQLGTGDATRRLVPTAVGDLEFESVTAFRAHTCGLTTNRDAYCWGGNAFGQVGNGETNTRVLTPSAVALPEAGSRAAR